MFHSLKENVFQWGKVRKIEKLNTEVSVILTDLVNDKKQDVVIKKIIELAKKHMDFETCMLYEWLPGNKLKMMYSDITYRSVLKYKEKLIFQSKKQLFKGNDICSQDDEGAVYHPVVIGRKMRYVFVFDDVDMEDYEEKRKERYRFYKDLELIMGNLRNRTLANRAQYVDSLTGLPNERQLRKDMEYCIVSEKDYIFAIIELDGMRELNETYGMDFGDRVIKNAKKIVEHHVRSGDGVYRFIGARLAVLLSGTQEKQFRIIRELHDELSGTVVATGQDGDVFCSVTIGALEVRYLDEKSVDYAYERCRHALTVERGGICFVGERREMQLYAESERQSQNAEADIESVEEVNECLQVEPDAVEEDVPVEETVNVEPEEIEKTLEERMEEETDEKKEECSEEVQDDGMEYSDADISDAVCEGIEEYNGTEEEEQCSEDFEEEIEESLKAAVEEVISEMEEQTPEEEMIGMGESTDSEECEPISDAGEKEEMCIDTFSILIPPEITAEVVKKEGNEEMSDRKEKTPEKTLEKEEDSPDGSFVQSTMMDMVQNTDTDKGTAKFVDISELDTKKKSKRKSKKKSDSVEMFGFYVH